MERKEQIKEASAKFAEHPHFTWDACSLRKGFQAGAEWADKHPLSNNSLVSRLFKRLKL